MGRVKAPTPRTLLMETQLGGSRLRQGPGA